MKRYALLAATAVVGGAIAFQGSVNLQATTPGSPQNGHLNVSGTAKSGFFKGNGSLLTNLNSGALNTGIITLTGTSPTYIIRGTNNSSAANASGLVGITTGTTGVNYGGWFESKSNQGRALFGYASATTGATYATYAVNNSNAGRACFGLATSLTGNTYGGFFSTLSEAGYGVLGQASSATGTTYGVYGRATSPTGFGVYSEGNMHATGIISGNGSGLTNLNAYNITSGLLQPDRFPIPFQLYEWSNTAIIKGTNTADGYEASGVHGVNASIYGLTYGVHGESYSNTGTGVRGDATAGSGTTRGGEFWSRSTSGRGVIGGAIAGTGINYGGLFFSNSTSGRAVSGEAVAETDLTTYGGWFETASTVGRGVYGVASAAGATDTPYGLRGQSNPATLGYGVFAVGDSGASGTKSFRIDHPFDPENKYLLHYSNESPTPQNQYFGTITTDATGYAWIELPDYFEEINKDIKYQLTVIDDGADFVFAKVTKKVRGNRFQVRTSKPNIEVSWTVIGTRNDLYARTKKPTDVREKTGSEKGQYQHPELYRLGPERGMDYDAERAKKPIKPKVR